MKKHLVLVSLLFAIAIPQAVIAGEASNALGVCMNDSMTGKERKQLSQWIFFAMAAHPEIKDFAKVPADARTKTDEQVAKIITRLLTENCIDQVKAAVKAEGQPAIVGAFELVGKVAMQELMANKEVMASISNYAKFLDQEKLGAVMNNKDGK